MKYLSNIKMVNNNVAEIDFIQFNNNSAEYTPNEREIVWNLEEGTFDVGLPNGVIGQMFEELFFTVKASGAIANGDVVVFAGSVGGEILASSGLNSSNLDAHFIMGVATEDIADEAYGKVTAFGRVRRINTITFDDANDQNEALLYMSTVTAGKLTNVQPTAPNIKSTIAAVKRWDEQVGEIVVRPDFGSKISDLHDVEITNPTSGQVISFDGTIWTNTDPSTVDSLDASEVVYDNSLFNIPQDNVQDALDQIFFMLQNVSFEYNGGFSNSEYSDLENIDGGDSQVITSGILQIDGGES